MHEDLIMLVSLSIDHRIVMVLTYHIYILFYAFSGGETGRFC